MKKILSLAMVGVMLFSALPMAYAADTQDYSQGTQVEYVANSDANRSYTITVPAKLTPKLGEAVTGTVTLSGKWASNETVTVTADAEVELTNSINAEDKHKLAITFPKMEYAGDNTEAKTYTETVTLDEMPAAALFGEWTGKFNYNVAFSDGTISANFTYVGSSGNTIKTIKAEEGMTWREFSESKYDDAYFMIAPESHGEYEGAVIAGLAGYLIDENNHLVSPDDVIDPNAHYETYLESSGSPSFGTTAPTWA